MNQQAYELGKRAYQSGDWLGAVAHLGEARAEGGANGEVDHLLGNAYMKLGRFDSAADSYGSALADVAYGKRGALSCNRGRALLAAGHAEEAVAALNDAVSDPSYATPYKAFLALGAAHEALGDVRSAGIAYRKAAIDEANPSPSASLCKLGSCFMRLGRSIDAVEAYRTALDFTTPLESQGQIWSDLGMAYVANNRMHEAVDAFSRAAADESMTLSAEAQASYDAARMAISALSDRRPSETDALLAAAGYGNVDPLDPTGASGELMPSPDDTGFFDVTEADLMAAEHSDRKIRRKHRHTGLKILIVILVLLILATAACGFAYYQGYGWPTQQSTVESLFSAKQQGTDLSPYISTSVSDAQAQEIFDALPSASSVTINGVDQSMNESSVHATASLAAGGQVDYLIELRRDGFGWKVVSVSSEFISKVSQTTTK